MLFDPKPTLDCRLPGLVVERELYDSVLETARELNISRGELMRRSLRFFLAQNATHSIVNDTPSIESKCNRDYR